MPSAAIHVLETRDCTAATEELEADHIARLIPGSHGAPPCVTDPSTGKLSARPSYQDFAVLLRAKSENGRIRRPAQAMGDSGMDRSAIGLFGLQGDFGDVIAAARPGQPAE